MVDVEVIVEYEYPDEDLTAYFYVWAFLFTLCVFFPIAVCTIFPDHDEKRNKHTRQEEDVESAALTPPLATIHKHHSQTSHHSHHSHQSTAQTAYQRGEDRRFCLGLFSVLCCLALFRPR